ncbi:hypothetical protein J828_3844, partial [Acinetobacter baumannii 25691_5]
MNSLFSPQALQLNQLIVFNVLNCIKPFKPALRKV